MADIEVQMLTPDRVRSVYPLIRQAVPTLDLAGWLRFERTLMRPRHPEQGGIVVASRPPRPFPSGLFCYRREHDLTHGKMLVAEHFVALDLLEPDQVLAALLRELDTLAKRFGCDAVRSVVHGSAPDVAGGLAAAGHRPEASQLWKPMPPRPPVQCAANQPRQDARRARGLSPRSVDDLLHSWWGSPRQAGARRMYLWSLVLAVHILCAALWVGGMFFALIVLRPSLAVLEVPQRVALHQQVFKRFFLVVWHLMPLLLLSGYVMLFGVYGGFAGAGWNVHLMHLLGLIMAAVFLLIVFGPYARFKRGQTTAIETIRRLILFNLVVGLITIVIAAI
jgi:uncharacterized membrane protein